MRRFLNLRVIAVATVGLIAVAGPFSHKCRYGTGQPRISQPCAGSWLRLSRGWALKFIKARRPITAQKRTMAFRSLNLTSTPTVGGFFAHNRTTTRGSGQPPSFLFNDSSIGKLTAPSNGVFFAINSSIAGPQFSHQAGTFEFEINSGRSRWTSAIYASTQGPGTISAVMYNGGFNTTTSSLYRWNGNPTSTAYDTALRPDRPETIGVLGIASHRADLRQEYCRSIGSAPSGSGTCAINTQSGGNTAGFFQANGACISGTVILTFAKSAPHGYICDAHDETTPGRMRSTRRDTRLTRRPYRPSWPHLTLFPSKCIGA